MEKNICEVCGTENEKEYKFCKNCGNSFEKEETNTANNYNPKNNNQYAPFNDIGNIGFTNNTENAVSTAEMAAFIGKKSNDILPKFTKMEISRSKVSWCWPAAVFGYLFGPIGSALWCFYRKMYKPAIILSAIGAIITVITSVMTWGYSSEIYNAVIDSFLNGNIEDGINAVLSIKPEETILTLLAGAIESISQIGSCVFMGLFGFYFYKNHCVNKIISFRTAQSDPRFYQMGLCAVGGVSGGMLAVGIILMFAINYIETFIITLGTII